MAAILNSAILNLAIFDSAILVFPLKLTHTCQDWVPPFAQRKYNLTSNPTICKKNFTHSFWLNLMMAVIFNSAMLVSDTLFSSLRFTQKHSYSILTLTQINLIWLKLIHSHLTWWWQPSWIWPSYFSRSNSLTLAKIGSHHMHKKSSLIQSDSTWWWQPSWTLPSWFQPFYTKKLHSFILTQLDFRSHLELGPCWIQTLASWIQTPWSSLSFMQKHSHFLSDYDSN